MNLRYCGNCGVVVNKNSLTPVMEEDHMADEDNKMVEKTEWINEKCYTVYLCPLCKTGQRFIS